MSDNSVVVLQVPPIGSPKGALVRLPSLNLSVTDTLIVTISDKFSRIFIVLTPTSYFPDNKVCTFEGVHEVVLGSNIRIGFSISGKLCVISKPFKCSYVPATLPTFSGGCQ